MTDKEPEEIADALVQHFDDILDMKGRPNTPKLEKMRNLAIDLYFKIERFETTIAYQERDGRETYRTIQALQAAGLIDDEQYHAANLLVTEARGSNNPFTDVDTILKRNRADDRKHEATTQEGE